jgi:hypothetical protein
MSSYQERKDARKAASRRPLRSTPTAATERQRPSGPRPGPSTYEGRRYDTTQPDTDWRWIIAPGENRRWYG